MQTYNLQGTIIKTHIHILNLQLTANLKIHTAF